MFQAVGHQGEDDVAVATQDLTPGERIQIRFLDGSDTREMEIGEPIPLGHKLALREIPEGGKVTEYGRFIGRATTAIQKGGHVHVHNLESLRW